MLRNLEELTPEKLAATQCRTPVEYLLKMVISLASRGLPLDRPVVLNPKYWSIGDIHALMEGLFDPRNEVREYILTRWEKNGIVKNPT